MPLINTTKFTVRVANIPLTLKNKSVPAYPAGVKIKIKTYTGLCTVSGYSFTMMWRSKLMEMMTNTGSLSG